MFEKYEEMYDNAPVRIIQNIRELKILSLLVENTQPNTILEIGSAEGGTLWWWDEITEDAKIISIEPNPEGQDWGESDKTYDELVEDIIIVEGKSQEDEVITTVKSEVDTLDFLFIDGCHKQECIKQDYENYSPLVENGIIVFHDVALSPPQNYKELSFPDARMYWLDLRDSLKHKKGHFTLELISSPDYENELMIGTGVIIKGLKPAKIIPKV